MKKEFKTFSPLDKAVRVYGRTFLQEPLPLFWTGSGVEFITDAVSLALDFDTDFETHEQWIRVEVDGVTFLRTPLPKGKSRFWVWQTMASGTQHRVQLYKEVQPMPKDLRSRLWLCGITCDGDLYPLPEKNCKIEFIGDSLSAGEGLNGASSIQDGISGVFSTQDHYAVETARAMNADFRILAQSGWGVYVGWDNDPGHTMPPIYEDVCGVLPEGKLPHDFTSWQPDIVVVHLGHNDRYALEEPAYIAPDGTRYKLELDSTGAPSTESRKHVTEAAVAFLHRLRELNPHAEIVWTYGMLGNIMLPAIEDALQQYKDETGEKIALIALPEFSPQQLGSNNHPGAEAHLAAAKILTQKLREYRLEKGDMPNAKK